MKQEVYKQIVGFEGWYEVSNFGQIRRSRPGKATYVGKILKPRISKRGRFHVCLRKNGLVANKDVHSVVASTFLGKRPKGKEINHIDGNCRNNNVDNLEYVSRKENMQHAYRLGLVKLGIGEDQHLAKLTTEQVIVIRSSNAPTRLLSRVFGVKPSTIKKVRKFITWQHVK